MGRALEKILIVFGIMVFVTFLVNHGHIDFSGVDWVVGKTSAAVSSPEGQAYINEIIGIAKNLFHDLFYGIKELIGYE